ncbi:hypothetical protein [Streptomyces spinosirectus]
MTTPKEHEELYWQIRARMLARHFAVGNRSRANLMTTNNTLDPNLPAGVPDGERELISRWSVSNFGGENPLLWSSRLLAAVAAEHQLGHPQAERVVTMALDTLDTLYKFRRGDHFDGYILRWDPVISSKWSADGSRCEAFLIDPASNAYLHCTPHRDPRHVPTRAAETLDRLLSPEQRVEYDAVWREHFEQYRVWEPSMDEIVGLVASYAVLFELVPTSAVRSRIVAQVTRLADYLAAHGYVLVRPEGGLTCRGSTGVLPAFEHPFNRVFERITGVGHPARIDFVGAMQQCGYWRLLQLPVDRLAAGIGAAQVFLSPLLTPWFNGGEFVGSMLFHAVNGALSTAPPAVREAMPFLQPALPRSIGLYAHRDTFDVNQPEEPALAHALSAVPTQLRYALFAQVMDLIPQSNLKIVRSFTPHLALTALGDADPLVRQEYLRSMALHRQRPVAKGETDLLNSCFASAVALLLGMNEAEEPRLVDLLDAHYRSLTAGAPEYLMLWGGDELPDPALDYLAGLALAWLYAKRRAEAGSPVTTANFPVPPAAGRTWPGVPMPGAVSARLPAIAARLGVDRLGEDIDLIDGPVTKSKPDSAPLSVPPTDEHVLVDQQHVFVRDTAGDVPSGIVLEPADEYEITATGTITAPELFAQPSDANGWYVVDDARFPLHSGQDPVSARKYALLGRLGGYFFVGTEHSRRRFLYHSSLPLYLRVNIEDQRAAKGEGGFHVQVRAWGPPRYRGSITFTAAEPMPAGQSARVTVNVVNRGSAWNLADGYWVVPADAANIWSATRVSLGATVPPRGWATVEVPVTVPMTVGTHPMGWRLVGGPSGRLDIATPLRQVQVATPRCAELRELIRNLNEEITALEQEIVRASSEEARALERELKKAQNKMITAKREATRLGCP